MLQLHFTNTPGFKTTAEALRRTRSRGRVLGKFLPLTNRSRNPEATTCWAYSSANEGTRSTWHPSFRNTAIVLNKLTPISCRLNYPSSLHIHSIQHACSTILTAVLSSTKAPGKYWAQAWLSAISLTLKSFILTTPSPTLSSFGTYSNPIDPMNQWKMSYLMIWTSNFSASEVDKTFFLSFETARPGSLAEQNAHRRSTRTATHRTDARLICLTELSLFHDPIVLHRFFVNFFHWHVQI